MLDDDFYLGDTPGMLWPRITVPESGYKLAASGAVGRNAYDEEEVALELLAYLKQHYAPLLDARYKLGLDAAVIAAKHDDELLELIARKRGAVMSGGRLTLQKAAEIVLTDLRSAALGRVTLEPPAEFEAWLAAAEVQEKARAARPAAQRVPSVMYSGVPPRLASAAQPKPISTASARSKPWPTNLPSRICPRPSG